MVYRRNATTSEFTSEKNYGNITGLSCSFRQPASTHSHCSHVHGYSLGIILLFGCEKLDNKNWVMDFGGLKKFKEWAQYMFDHTIVLDTNDPHINLFKVLEDANVATLRYLDGVGCEKFAEHCFAKMNELIEYEIAIGNPHINPTVYIKKVTVYEHEGNSASYSEE